jgi:hypothetical protein
MINLQQDAEGFVRMNRHFPESVLISITFTGGTTETFTGLQLNSVFDVAQADFRLQNNLDEKGFSRAEPKTVRPKTSIEFVQVQPGMAS